MKRPRFSLFLRRGRTETQDASLVDVLPPACNEQRSELIHRDAYEPRRVQYLLVQDVGVGFTVRSGVPRLVTPARLSPRRAPLISCHNRARFPRKTPSGHPRGSQGILYTETCPEQEKKASGCKSCCHRPCALVGLTGFEPATPTPPVWCAAKLRHSPPPRKKAVGLPEETRLAYTTCSAH